MMELGHKEFQHAIYFLMYFDNKNQNFSVLSLDYDLKQCDAAQLATPSHMDHSGRGQRPDKVSWAGLMNGSRIAA